jgi:hypothetical protein
VAIPESQLKTWSAQGSVAQSAATYETIKKVLNDLAAPYHTRDFSIFLQGSYGNDTNVYKDSDVDIVICLDQTYYSDTNLLTDIAKNAFEKARSPASYGYDQFKKEVIDWLTGQFGSSVKPGKKAIFIKGNGARRDADVVVSAKHRRYRRGSTGTDYEYDEGICFWTSSGVQIVNFPKQHSANCTTKHQATNSWFKPLVRVYKNMRNRMVDDGKLVEGVAPSYFIEGMLWNVPISQYGVTYKDSWMNTFNWILQADKTQLACASDLHWLVRDNANVCWSTANFDTFIAAAKNYWNNWS